jgi:quercetin dioxygenase-like cupin family protein
MSKRMFGFAILVMLFGGTASATPVIGTITVETVRGPFAEDLKINTRFENGAKVRLKTNGPIELITQRIVAEPGASFGWHSHPGENVNVVKQGTLTLYHDDACAQGMEFGPGTSFPTHPSDVHLARNEGTDTLVFFATYLAPLATPPLPVRVDEPSPGPGCPQ